jgi:YidC/Oxa1 family membrane protein insertase
MPDPEKKEISMETRLLLAFLLMGAVLFLTPLLYKPAGPTRTGPPPQPAAQAVKPAPPPAKPAEAARAPVQPAAGIVAASEEDSFVVETDLYRIVFSNRGGVVHSWTLKKYKDHSGAPLELVNAEMAKKTGYPFSVIFKGQKPDVDIDQKLFVAKPATDGLGFDFEFSNASITTRKSFRFSKNSYLAQINSTVSANGSLVPHYLAWRGGFGDRSVPGWLSHLRTVSYDPAQGKLIAKEASEAKDGPVTTEASFTFAGLADTFFAAVFMPRGNTPFELQTLSDWGAPTPGAKEEAHVGAAVGGDGRNEFALFIGPKDIDLLREVDPRLEQLVDFGWFAFVARPLFLSLNWVNNHWVHNYGWSIIIVTVIINMLMLPLKFTSLKSARKMQSVQPHIAAIQAKYKGLSARDPKKLEQNQEIMKVYQQHGINPMSGCMPLLLQLPFFYAFYTVLTVAIEMRGASWLWVTDLSQPETIPIRLLPLAMIATQFLLTKMTPTPSADPAQQKMMLFMPLMFGVLFWSASSGLVLYWLTGNLIGILQQWFFNRIAGPAPVPAPAAAVKPVGKQKGSRKS